ncbi:MAG: sigma 54-interacting transcriptional regulator [Planctomycetes bacterium]|nr:sigma 54-interacting transcriptional regulator [Planctomycetota bacterium]
MPLFDDVDRRFAEAISRLSYCNPFLPQRLHLEREALGDAFCDEGPVWSKRIHMDDRRKNIERLYDCTEKLAVKTRQRLEAGEPATERHLILYEDVVLYWLYHRYREHLRRSLEDAARSPGKPLKANYWSDYRRDFESCLRISGRTMPTGHDPGHIFACFFQLRRAFQHIFEYVLGSSMPAARLRAAVWQSIFTHDMRRYRRTLYRRMGDFTTLVTGPTGTGKELVARAIGLSRYIPFNEKQQQFDDFAGTFFPLNLSALSPTLIESELFGHCRGAFTGAVADRVGWLEACPLLGTVFLDEIGELDAALQVKLLRVLQSRTFQRSGETQDRRFAGKIIAATNRNLAEELQAGRFRDDFYYRLCSDQFAAPTLREQLTDSPDDLRSLILFMVERIVGEDDSELAAEVEVWIHDHLGPTYPWPGNMRELEQCVRNVLIRGRYDPLPRRGAHAPAEPYRELVEQAAAGALTADELLARYCTLVYVQTGSYEQAARRLGLDRRTVKAKVDEGLLRQMQDQNSS